MYAIFPEFRKAKRRNELWNPRPIDLWSVSNGGAEIISAVSVKNGRELPRNVPSVRKSRELTWAGSGRLPAGARKVTGFLTSNLGHDGSS
jgi:hypothetical protein